MSNENRVHENRTLADIADLEGFDFKLIGRRLRRVDELHNPPVVSESTEIGRFKPKKHAKENQATGNSEKGSYFVKVTGV